MKWFWAFVALLAIVAGMVLVTSGRAPSSARVDDGPTPDQASRFGVDESAANDAPQPRGAKGSMDGTPPASNAPSVGDQPPSTIETTSAAGTPSAPPSAPLSARPPAEPAPLTAILGLDLPGLGPSGGTADTTGTAAVPRPDDRSPDEIVRRLDPRTLELDGRFRVIGNGSPDDPYRISWELLTSAIATIDPKRDLLRAPPWVRLLDGTTIEISGYYSTPVRVPEAKNLLLTLNRWDGCCIGLPPTPFDAIDVAMREPLAFKGLHVIRFGTFRGRLVVEPIAAAGFLLGLYRLEDATFETK
jgi:hypothetical protein